jgi:hypothetical protein
MPGSRLHNVEWRGENWPYAGATRALGSLATVLLPKQVARSKSAMRYSDDEGKFRRWMGPGNTRASLA